MFCSASLLIPGVHAAHWLGGRPLPCHSSSLLTCATPLFILQDTWAYYRRNKLGPITLFQARGPGARGGAGRRGRERAAPLGQHMRHGPAGGSSVRASALCTLGSAVATLFTPTRSPAPRLPINLCPLTHSQILRPVHSNDERYQAVVSHLIDVGLLSSEC